MHGPEDLSGRVALVTGATSGIGQAVANGLALAGADVIAVARGPRDVDGARFISADVGDPESIARLAAEVGEVDILVNCAGLAVFGPTDALAVADFDALFATNVRGPYYLVAAFAPGMAERGTGSIVSISSMAGSVGLPGSAAYGATKAAVESLTRAWAIEYSPRGVRVNSVAPGPTYSSALTREEFDAFAPTIPIELL